MSGFVIAMALLGELSFAVMDIVIKRLRNRGAQTLAVLAVFSFSMPFWIVLIAVAVGKGNAVITPAYAAVAGLWLVSCFFLCFGGTYLARFQGLSEAAGYRFGFTVLLALASDIFIFGKTFHITALLAIALLFIGGFLLNICRQKHIEDNFKMSLIRRLPAIFFISLVQVATYTLFKQGAEMQSSLWFHNAILQALLFSTFLVMGQSYLQRDIRDNKIPTPYIVALCVIVFLAATGDSFAIAGMPVTVFVMFSLIRGAMFAVHDIITKELPLTRVSIAALIILLGGLACAALLKASG